MIDCNVVVNVSGVCNGKVVVDLLLNRGGVVAVGALLVVVLLRLIRVGRTAGLRVVV